MGYGKTGLLTFHHVLNYGAILQCFALQESIVGIGGSCKVIPYECQRLLENDRILKKGFPKPVQMAKYISQGYGTGRKKRNFRKFAEQYLDLADSVRWEEFDRIVVGSDQVWNLSLTGMDYTYMLENADCQKIAYAASFGEAPVPKSEEGRLMKAIRQFDSLSMRERASCEMLRSRGIDAAEVVDPVLLMEECRWSDLAARSAVERPKHYILIYCVEKSQEVFRYARKVSEAFGYPIVYLNQNLLFREKDFIYRRGVSPGQFLAWIREADFIVTNSFHGTAFSVIFEKKFASDTQWHGGENQRMVNLLEKLHLKGRAIQCLPEDDIDREIDYKTVKKQLYECRSQSRDYLRKALEK